MLIASQFKKQIALITTKMKIFNCRNRMTIWKPLKMRTTNFSNIPILEFTTTKLTKQQIEGSSYEDLVNKITKLYNYQQYKIPSALALLQVHHQYSIFKPGDWVLDIGAGPHYSWTDLALKLTHTASGSNKVISNDMKEGRHPKQNNIAVVGNFMEEPVRTKIAMHLINRQLDTILIDATPQFSGNQQADASYTLDIFIMALEFSQYYLKKGGTIIFKTVQSPLSLQNQNQAKFFFNEVYRYKPSNFRINSPAFFYILKGYMMTENLQGVQNLLKEYKKAKNNYAKMKVIQKYRQLYKWDPVLIIQNSAKQEIAKLREQGKKNSEIMKIYENDPYVKVKEILSMLDILEDKKSHVIDQKQAASKLLTGQGLGQDLPKSQQQFAQRIYAQMDRIEKEEKEKAQEKKKKKEKGKGKKYDSSKVESKAPLAQDQVYMKSTQVKPSDRPIDNQQYEYRAQDLYGYNPNNPQQAIHLRIRKTKKQEMQQRKIQVFKLAKSFPEVKQALENNKLSFEEEWRRRQKLFFSQFGEFKDEGQKEDELDEEEEVAGQDKSKKKTKSMQQEDMSFQSFLKKTERNKKGVKKQSWDDLTEQENQFAGNIKSKLNFINKKQQRKTPQMSSQFDFDDMDQSIRQNERLQTQMLSQQEFDRVNKVQYLKSKPSKSDRPVNSKKNRKQGGGPMNYFKNKNKNKS